MLNIEKIDGSLKSKVGTKCKLKIQTDAMQNSLEHFNTEYDVFL